MPKKSLYDPSQPTHRAIRDRKEPLDWRDRVNAIHALHDIPYGIHEIALTDKAWQVRRAAVWMRDLTEAQITRALGDESQSVRTAAVTRFYPRLSAQQKQDGLRSEILLQAYRVLFHCGVAQALESIPAQQRSPTPSPLEEGDEQLSLSPAFAP